MPVLWGSGLALVRRVLPARRWRRLRTESEIEVDVQELPCLGRLFLVTLNTLSQ
jgi:hypothetical protein